MPTLLRVSTYLVKLKNVELSGTFKAYGEVGKIVRKLVKSGKMTDVGDVVICSEVEGCGVQLCG